MNDVHTFCPRTLLVDQSPLHAIAALPHVERVHRHYRGGAGVVAHQILRQLGEQLPRRRLIGPVRAIEETDVHGVATTALARSVLYHWIVRISPVLKAVVAAKPNEF